MKKEEFDNLVEDIVISEGLFYDESGIPNLRMIEAFDYVEAICNKKGEVVLYLVANESDDEITTIREKDNPKLFRGEW